MEFLSFPPGYKLTQEKKFTEFNGFRVYITQRSWLGNTYIGKSEGENFLKELQETINITKKTDSKNMLPFSVDLSFIVDSSVFKGKDEFSSTLLEFLEEIEDFEEEGGPKKNVRMRYLRKLKLYAEKPEAYPYLYRWCRDYPFHSFTKELREVLEHNMHVRVNKTIKTLQKKYISFVQKYPDSDTAIGEFAGIFLKEVSACIAPLYKYVWSEAGLFYIAMWCTNLFIEQIQKIKKAETGINLKENDIYFVIAISRSGYKNEVSCSFYDWAENGKISEVHKKLFLEYETHIHEVGRLHYSKLGVSFAPTLNGKNIHSDKLENDSQEANVLKEISKWAATRIKEYNNSQKTTDWTHVVTSDFFKGLGIREIKFESVNTVQGPEEEELSLLVSACCELEYSYDGLNYFRILFPLFKTKEWEELDSYQCVLNAYAICLYHDFLFSSDYKLIPIASTDEDTQIGAPYKLVFNKELNGSVFAFGKKGTSTHRKMSKQDKERVMKEHWVSFHFRRLPRGYKASEEAQRTARKYGFKSIPQGYTFVDIFAKGGEGKSISTANISALDVLSKTLNKAQHLKGNVSDAAR